MGWPAAVLPPPPLLQSCPPLASHLSRFPPFPPPLPPLLPVMPVRHVPSIAAAGDAAYAVSTGAVPTVTPARCRFFAAGACAAGDDCRFIHELPEHLRPPPAPAPGPNVPLVRPRAADYSVPAGGAGLGAGGAGGGGCAPAGGAPAPGVEAPGDGYVDFSAAYAGAFASAVAVPSPPRRQLPLAPHLSSSLPASGLGGFAADLLAVGGGRPAEEGDDVGGVLLRGKLGGGKHGAVGDGKVGLSAGGGGARWAPGGGGGGGGGRGATSGSWDATPAVHDSWDATPAANGGWDAATVRNGGWEGAVAGHGGWDGTSAARRVPPNPWAAATPFAPLLPVGMTGRHVDAPVTGGAPYGPSGGGVAGGGGSGCGSAATDALTARFGAATLGGGGTRGLYTTHAPSDRSAHHRLTAAASAFTPGSAGAGAGAPLPATAPPPPLCRFHLAGSCRYGDSCRYTHGVPCPVCGENAVHPTDGAEAERHLLACGWLVAGDVTGPPLPSSSTCGSPRGLAPVSGVGGPPLLSAADEASQVALRCAICHESVRGRGRRFGLLTECDHVFCLECVRAVRSTVAAAGGREAVRGCSVCGVESFLVVPSDTYPRSAAEKAGAAARYKAKLKRVPCMHFRYGEGVCPFGVTSCLYAHVDREGVPVAADGREVVVDGEGVATGRRGLSMGDFLVVKTVKGKKRRGAGAGGGAG